MPYGQLSPATLRPDRKGEGFRHLQCPSGRAGEHRGRLAHHTPCCAYESCDGLEEPVCGRESCGEHQRAEPGGEQAATGLVFQAGRREP